MKTKLLLLCAAILTSGCAGSSYKGPSLKFGIGYEGVELSVTLVSKAPVPSLTEAGNAFNTLLPGGKTPIPAAP
jgi:hypothetical protein